MYLDEVIILLNQISKRKKEEYRMLLAISQNPHVKEPKLLWDALSYKEEENDEPVDLEKELGKLKMAMSDNPRIMIK